MHRHHRRHARHHGQHSFYGRDPAKSKKRKKKLPAGLRARLSFIKKMKRQGMTFKQASRAWKTHKRSMIGGKGYSSRSNWDIDNVTQLENALKRLIGGGAKVPVLRGSDTLAMRKQKLLKTIAMIEQGIGVLKEKEAEEDLTAKEERDLQAQIKRLEDEIRARREAHRKAAEWKRKGWSSEQEAAEQSRQGDPDRRKGKKSKTKGKGKKRKAKAKGKKKISAGLRRYQAALKKLKRSGMTHKQAQSHLKKQKKKHKKSARDPY
jgi:hypothetical protein